MTFVRTVAGAVLTGRLYTSRRAILRGSIGSLGLAVTLLEYAYYGGDHSRWKVVPLLTVAGLAQIFFCRRNRRSNEQLSYPLYVSMVGTWLMSAALMGPAFALVPMAVLFAIASEFKTKFKGRLGESVHRGCILGLSTVGALHTFLILQKQNIFNNPAGLITSALAAVTVIIIIDLFFSWFGIEEYHDLSVLLHPQGLRDRAAAVPAILLGACCGLALHQGGGFLWLALFAMPSISLYRASTASELESIVDLDSETGLSSPAAWRCAVDRYLDYGRGPSAMLILDLDYFKNINDRWGHSAGDEVLKALGETLRSIVRKGDKVGRIGGEEFGIWLPNVSPVQATEMAERIRNAISAMRVPVVTNTGEKTVILHRTVSIGVSFMPSDGEDLNDLSLVADKRLYAAKRGGRNRVCDFA